ncbi:MAG: oligosaccharide flippase family protein [Brevundimonas sp.]|uniref:lipopolysaccharide biosynthesis protein n=2 Tax=Brevundimonas sp. TaxID=1871086 RepID=UPI0026266A37|nr:oligosaccharide flippase family protein [Brevundimonas sp.]MDI6623121.1 oligosaccharide flippase family protein [Brevundimonas sp.]
MRARIEALLPKSAFLRNVGLLTGGTVLAQGILALSLPVLTRLYSPEDFSLLAVYTSLLGLITVVSCLRFNIAIPLPEDDRVAMNLLLLALGAAALVALATAVPVFAMPGTIAALLGQPAIKAHLWMIPVGVILASSYDALQYWASRKRRFALISQTRVTRAAGGTGTQIGIGSFSATPFGLILGQVVYSGVGVVGLLRSLGRHDRAAATGISGATLARTASEYRKFPLFSVPEALFNTAGLELAILIIAAAAAGPEAGFLMLAMRVMGLPLGLVGTSVGQVYLTEAPQKWRDGELAGFTRRMMWSLFKTGTPPLIVAAVACPLLFPLIFGAEWARAGVIVAWLTPMFILQFVASPVSMVLHVVGKLAAAMWLQIAGGVFRVGSVVIAAQVAPAWITETFAVTGALFYCGMVALVYASIRRMERS